MDYESLKMTTETDSVFGPNSLGKNVRNLIAMLKSCWLLLFLLFFNGLTQAIAQEITVVNENLYVLPYVHVKNLQTNRNLVADHNGVLHISSRFCQAGDSLQLTYMGFQDAVIICSNDSMPELIKMKADTITFNEVPVYSLAHRKTYKIKPKMTFGRNIQDGSLINYPMTSGKMLVQQLVLGDTLVRIEEIILWSEGKADSVLLRFSVQDTFNTYLHEVFAQEVWVRGGKIHLKDLKLHCANPNGIYYLFIETKEVKAKDTFHLHGRMYANNTENQPDIYEHLASAPRGWVHGLPWGLLLKVKYRVQ